MTAEHHQLPPARSWAAMHGRDRLWYTLGVGFGTGLAPKASGTVASFAVLALMPLWAWIGVWPSLLLVLLMCIVGIPICGRTADLMGVHDDGRIVWDEFAGQSIALMPLLWAAPALGWNLATLVNVLIAFGLFRLFDIWKPWPIRYLDQQVHGGLGIMADDILAGVIAALLLTPWLIWGAAL